MRIIMTFYPYLSGNWSEIIFVDGQLNEAGKFLFGDNSEVPMGKDYVLSKDCIYIHSGCRHCAIYLYQCITALVLLLRHLNTSDLGFEFRFGSTECLRGMYVKFHYHYPRRSR